MKHPSWRTQATPKSDIWLTSLHKSSDVLSSDLRNSHEFTKICMHLQGNNSFIQIFKKRVKPRTCDGIHLLLRWRVVICDLSEWRERYVGVQVQTQHEIMYLVKKRKKKKRKCFGCSFIQLEQTSKFPLDELIKVPSRHGPPWCWTMQSR